MKATCKNCTNVFEQQIMDYFNYGVDCEYYCILAMTECIDRTGNILEIEDPTFKVNEDHQCSDFKVKT